MDNNQWYHFLLKWTFAYLELGGGYIPTGHFSTGGDTFGLWWGYEDN
jgi:hypothetical protein